MTATNTVNLETKMTHIRKLLTLAQGEANKEEAYQALLKAQAMMAKYGIDSVDMAPTQEVEPIVELPCKHRNNTGFRMPLSVIIARNFKCKVIYIDGIVHMVGRKTDAEIARNTFEFAYLFVKRNGEKEIAVAREKFGTARGVFNSYAQGFMAGLSKALDKQCEALMIVRPKVVDEYYAERFGKAKPIGKRFMDTGFVAGAYSRGYTAGQSALDRNKITD